MNGAAKNRTMFFRMRPIPPASATAASAATGRTTTFSATAGTARASRALPSIISGDSGGLGAGFGGLGAIAGDDHNRGPRPACLDLLGHLEPAHAGHADVGVDEV